MEKALAGERFSLLKRSCDTIDDDDWLDKDTTPLLAGMVSSDEYSG
jgi:hypothetical protein